MTNLLVILRGNSASGKTTLANELQKQIGYKDCVLIHQDVIRKEILHTNDKKDNPAIKMIENLINFCLKEYPVTVVEGILRKDVYGNMLTGIIDKNKTNTLTYYLEIPFENTIKNDQTKTISFGAQKLQSWWREKDYLTNQDIILKDTDEFSFPRIILNDISKRLTNKD